MGPIDRDVGPLRTGNDSLRRNGAVDAILLRVGRAYTVRKSHLSLPGHANAFAIGDIACFTHQDGKPLPGVSPVAMQEARAVAESIERTIGGAERKAFHYFDKGTMATIGRSRAVAVSGKLRMSGFVAWLAWLVVHIWYLIGFRNRFVVMFSWAWSYFTYKRGARLITGRRYEPPVTSSRSREV